jgi:hypothetical protein
MSEIREHLKFMNPLEIILNLETEESVKEFLLLTEDEQEKFLDDCTNHFIEIKQKWYAFFEQVQSQRT